jgi:hypothetical protein
MEDRIFMQKEYNDLYALDLEELLVPGELKSFIIRECGEVNKVSFYKDRSGIVYRTMQKMEQVI